MRSLQQCIYDYLVEKGMSRIAESFSRAINLGNERLARNEGSNFLLDLWIKAYDEHAAKHSAPSTSNEDPLAEIRQKLLPSLPRPDGLSMQLSTALDSSSRARIQSTNRTLRIGHSSGFQQQGVGFGRANPQPRAGPSHYGNEAGSSSAMPNRMLVTGTERVHTRTTLPDLNSPAPEEYQNSLEAQQRVLATTAPAAAAAAAATQAAPSLRTSNKRTRWSPLRLGAPEIRLGSMAVRNEEIGGSSQPRGVGNVYTNRLQVTKSLQMADFQLLCCDFSSSGELLACIGRDKKVLLLNTKNLRFTGTPEGDRITDVRFRHGSTVFATSFRKTVQLWDATNPNASLFNLTGHEEPVISLDFHSRQVDLLCSAGFRSVRLWNINHRTCDSFIARAVRQVRFQPGDGNMLAASTGKEISLFDVETKSLVLSLKGHDKPVNAFCWDATGKYIASVSDDEARVWSVGAGARSIHGIHSGGKRFASCTYRPGHSQTVVIGTDKSLVVWCPSEGNNTESVMAHRGMIWGLCSSTQSGVVASTNDDNCVKLWK